MTSTLCHLVVKPLHRVEGDVGCCPLPAFPPPPAGSSAVPTAAPTTPAPRRLEDSQQAPEPSSEAGVKHWRSEALLRSAGCAAGAEASLGRCEGRGGGEEGRGTPGRAGGE